MRQKLFSVTAKDCDWQTMTAGGPGGQHQNRSQTAIRVVHRASGAVGESREYKSQIANKRAAFRRMAETKLFRTWIRRQAAMLTGERKTIEQQVDDAMAPEYLKIEAHDEHGRWIPVSV